MALTSGTRLGPYEVLAAIGAGGMGEVYRARDAKLGRDVALKVLPDAFARDAERMARFQREAKVLASLSHPNIASIHGLEDSGATHALVMELIGGPTLAERIKSGAIPINEALLIAKQICEALEYAHEHGIVHRDLKPANVKLTADDAVKVLDFGLAKAFEGDASSIDIANSPTMSRMATQAGVLLGTAAYMSPEQAKGKAVDRRADIWGFGCVLYEMLTGKMAFQGETVTDTLAAVIMRDPDWSRIPTATPVRIRVLLQRCLQKDPKQRLQAIGDARISLEEVLSGAQDPALAGATSRAPGQRWLWPVVAAVCAVVAIGGWLAFLYLRPKPPSAQAMRFEIPMPEKTMPRGYFALSPDGLKLAFLAADASGATRVWVRSIDAVDARPLEGTEGVSDLPFWSPDGRFIAFPTPGKLKKVEAVGGPPVTLCDSISVVLGGAWNGDDKIVFGTAAGLEQVSASGGSATPITTGGPSAAPFFLPDGRHFVYLHPTIQGTGMGIYVGSVDAKPQEQASRKLLADYSQAIYAPSSDPAVGYLLFVRGANPGRPLGTLMAQEFDTRRLELVGEAVPIAEQVAISGFSASATDVLVYVVGTQSAPGGGVRGIMQGQLTWFDREGKALGTVGEIGSYRTLALSPDGKRVAFDRADPQNPSTRNIWIYEFERGVTTRFTFSTGWDTNPVWSPDGSRIAFDSNRDGAFDLYQKISNLAGDDELLYRSSEAKAPSGWSPDGRFLLYFLPLPPSRVSLLPVSGGEADRKAVLLTHSEFNEAAARFSPDGRWIAYSSNESGRDEVYVRPFDAASVTGSSSAGATTVTGKWMASKDGGTTPLWRRDGKELFYLSLDGSAMAVDVNTSGVFQAGIPKALFKVPPGELYWDVSSDGRRFLMAAPTRTNSSTPAPFNVVLNWQATLKKQ